MSYLDRCRARCRNAEEDEGFTLIELLVVLLIIGILLAIAIPTFLSVTKGANGTAAQSNLQTALTGSDTFYTNNSQSYTGLLTSSTQTSTLAQIDTGLTYQSNAAVSSAHQVSVSVEGGGQVVILEAYAPGQSDCWGILDIKSTQTTAVLTETNTGTYYFVKRNQTSCTAGTTGEDAISSTKFPSA